MTGNEILKGAASLMGFGEPSEEMNSIGITVINFVLEDLGKTALKTIDDNIELTETERSALLSGTSMLLSVAIGDLRAKECFSAIYNEKRSRVKIAKGKVTDSLPNGEVL